VRCPDSNSITCDTVGPAIELTKPAETLEYNDRRSPRQMVARTGNGHGPRGTYFEGFLRPAGLTSHGPLKV
jgi:hypothetical protein